MSRRGTWAAAILVTAAAFAGCGESGGVAPPPPDRAASWVDREAEPPYIASLDVNPADASLYLATNRGLYVVAEGSRRPRRITGRLDTRLGAAAVSRALAVHFTGPDELVGSGHPDTQGTLPPLLGLMRSRDAGRTWSSVAALGDSDFHDLQVVDDRLILGVAGRAQALITDDGGRTFETRTTPQPLVDLEVDPDDPRRWVATTHEDLFVSRTDGRTWRARDTKGSVRVAWPPGGTLYRADPEGPVLASTDGGESWERRGSVGELPQALTAQGGELYAALLDGSVRTSADGGLTWRVRVPAQ